MTRHRMTNADACGACEWTASTLACWSDCAYSYLRLGRRGYGGTAKADADGGGGDASDVASIGRSTEMLYEMTISGLFVGGTIWLAWFFGGILGVSVLGGYVVAMCLLGRCLYYDD